MTDSKPGSRRYIPTVLLAILAVAACSTAQTATTTAATTTAVVSATTVLVDAAACQADMAAIKGTTLASAAKAATDPNCIAALNAAVAGGASVAATVAVKPAS